MININELRVGNYYTRNGIKEIMTIELMSDIFLKKVSCEDFKNVQFDDNWLDEFKIIKKTESTYFFDTSRLGFLKTNFDDFELFCDKVIDTAYNTERVWLWTNFKYVHQLQNLLLVSNRLRISPNYWNKKVEWTFNISETTHYI